MIVKNFIQNQDIEIIVQMKIVHNFHELLEYYVDFFEDTVSL